MKKMIKVVLASTLTLFILGGCTQNSVKTTAAHESATQLQLHGYHSQKELQNAITTAGEKIGLKITEFKYNALIAEHIDGSNSSSATITFDKEEITIVPDSNDFDTTRVLKAIAKELHQENDQ